MTSVRITIRGERYITLEAVAECYGCEYRWVRTVYDVGLLGRGEVVENSIAIRTELLDRVADIRRLHAYHGVGLDALAALLDLEDL